MKKIKAILILALIACVSFIIGCAPAKNPVTITGFDVQETIIVEAGNYVTIKYPIVIDSDGNVLDVYCEVVDSEGNYVELITGKFMADDVAGYYINYVVYTSDKVIHKKETKVNVYTSLTIIDEQMNLVDISTSDKVSGGKLDLMDIINTTGKSLISQLTDDISAFTFIITDNVGKETTVPNGVITVSSVAKRAYNFSVSYGENVIYNGKFDLYDSNDGIIWNTFDMLDLNKEWKSHQGNVYTGETNRYYSFSIGTVNGKEGNFAKWTDTGSVGGYHQTFAILPAHSVEYYNQFVGKGYEISFEVMYETENTPSTSSFRKYVSGFNSVPNEHYPNTWYKMSYSIDAISDAYGYMVGNTTNSEARKKAGLYSLDGGTVINNETDRSMPFNLYMSEIRIVEPLDIDAVVDQEMNLVDLSTSDKISNGKLDLFDIISSEGLSAISELNINSSDLTFTITDNAGNETDIPNGKITVNSIAKRAYAFAVSYDYELVYSGKFDLYDSNDGVVWNTFDTLNTQSDWKSHQGSSYTPETNKYYNFSTGTISGKEGTFAKWTRNTANGYSGGYAQTFAILPVHSVEYYNQFVGQGYEISFEVMYETESTPSVSSFRKYVSGFDSTPNEHYPNTWYKMSYSIDDISESYDYIVGNTKNSTSRKKAGLYSLDGGTAINTESDRTMSFNVYIGAINIAIPAKIEAILDQEMNLIDLSTSNKVSDGKLDLFDIISSEGLSSISEISNNASDFTFVITDNTGKETTVPNGKITVNSVAKRAYTFTVSYNYELVYSGKFDLYDSNDGVVWNTFTAMDTNKDWRSYQGNAGTAETNKYYDFSIGAISGKTGNFAKWTLNQTTGSTGGFAQSFAIMPLHSVEYYTQYQNLDYEIKFDVMFELADEYTGLDDFRKYSHGNDGTPYTHTAGTWYNNFSFSLDSLITNYNTITGTGSRAHVSASLYSLAGGVVNSSASNEVKAIRFNVYMSEIRIVEPININQTTDQFMNLIDISTSDKISDGKFNLTSIISSEGMTEINKITSDQSDLTFVITDNVGKKTTVSNGIITVNSIAKRAYTFTVSYEDSLIYSGKFDLYDSNDGVVWNTFDMIDATKEWKSHQGNIYTSETNKYYNFSTGAMSGKEGTFAKWIRNGTSGLSGAYTQHFAILPVHSLEYYTQYVGQGYKISFEYMYETQSPPSTETWNKYAGGFDVAFTQPKPGQWYTMNYSIDSIIDAYSYIIGENANSSSRRGALLSFSGGTAANNETDKTMAFDFYMGAITITKTEA